MTAKEFSHKALQKLEQKFSKRESSQLLSILFEDIAGITALDSSRAIEDISKIEAGIRDLLNDRPIQYITGTADFYGLKFYVNDHVLIPRPETEELVRCILEDHGSHKKLMDVLDVGLGSGCIALTLAKKHRYLRVTGAEVSMDALNVARVNSKRLGTKVSFALMDIKDQSYWEALGIYDIIVSNPPYIKEEDRSHMHRRVLMHEPELALFAGEDPLVFYRTIKKFAEKHLSPDGDIYLEVHEDLAGEVAAIYEDAQVDILKDMQGKNRIIRARYSN